MFIKKLVISTPTEIIRDIDFHSGLNLIIDDTPTENSKATGNNVGKTTVLKLVDFCLGAKPTTIYADTENKNEVYSLVRDFLVDNQVEIKLVLVDSLNDPESKQLIIQRNFLSSTKTVRKINGEEIASKDFEGELERRLVPGKQNEKPTFRQIISHNIRYRDENITNTLNTLNKFTTDIEYETLYLYLLGCGFNRGEEKSLLDEKLKQEENALRILLRNKTQNNYVIALGLVNDEIETLTEKKNSLNLNKTLEEDIDHLNLAKYKIDKLASQITRFEIRKSLIEESINQLEKDVSNIDSGSLHLLYNEARTNITGLQKTFDDLLLFHNQMISEKKRYISQELPGINQRLVECKKELGEIRVEEKNLTEKITGGNSFIDLDSLITEMNNKFRLKGEYETILSQTNEISCTIQDLKNKISDIDKELFSESFESRLKDKVKKFNKYFSLVSQELYGETYALSYDQKENKKGTKSYQFSAFNANLSSGKKQGEILCFDLAYILFADEEKIPCFHFLLNDKKELLHDNQLIKVAEFVKSKNIQLVISILKDKLPASVLKGAHVAIELSPESKLFKIEK